MGWADAAIEKLQNGEEAQMRPRGNSMSGKVESGQLVTLRPFDPLSYVVGDVVLVKVKGRIYLHLIKAIAGSRILIGNNKGHDNGWTNVGSIYGKAIRVEP